VILPLFFAAAAAAAIVSRRRIKVKVEREYVTRFHMRSDGVAEGAESFSLPGTNGCGVLLLHGSGDSPQTLRYLAHQLNASGYAVSAPLLPGHGRSPRAFARATADDYVSAARDALHDLKGSNQRVAVVGLSMGGAIAARLGAEDATISALILLAPYLVPHPTVRRVGATAPLWGILTPYLLGRGEASVFDESASKESRAYGTFSPGALHALLGTAARGMEAVPRLRVPVMVVNSEQDNRIPRECAEQALRAFRTPPETHWVSGCGHVITIDYCKEHVAELVKTFLDAHAR
jgi:carboxylesterase